MKEWNQIKENRLRQMDCIHQITCAASQIRGMELVDRDLLNYRKNTENSSKAIRRFEENKYD
jgi:hypothetical protein